MAHKIGYVMQSNSMMSGTIRDNILYGINRKVDDEELIGVAKLANCHDFIMQFDEGYDTMVGEAWTQIIRWSTTKDRYR